MATPPIETAPRHQKRSEFFREVRKLIHKQGVTPRHTATEYYNPCLHSLRRKMPPFVSKKLSAIGDTVAKQPVVHVVTTPGASPSYAVSPRAPSSVSTGVETKQPDASNASSAAFVALTAKGFDPFRIVILKTTGDVFALCTSVIYGDRIAVYIPDSVVCGDFPKEIRTDETKEQVIVNESEAKDRGAFDLAMSAGLAAGAIDLAPNGRIIGVLTASATNAVTARYFALMCRSDPEAASPISIKSNSANDIFIFAQTDGAKDELECMDADHVYAMPRAVFPVIHYNFAVSGEFLTPGVAEELRTQIAQVEHSFVNGTFERLTGEWESSETRIGRNITGISEHVRSCLMARDRVASARGTSVAKQAEMAIYSARVQDIVGGLHASIAEALNTIEDAIDVAKASLYVETRRSVAQKVSNAAFAKAKTWGYPPALDAIDFSSNTGLMDAAIVDSIPDSMREILVRMKTAIEAAKLQA